MFFLSVPLTEVVQFFPLTHVLFLIFKYSSRLRYFVIAVFFIYFRTLWMNCIALALLGLGIAPLFIPALADMGESAE